MLKTGAILILHGFAVFSLFHLANSSSNDSKCLPVAEILPFGGCRPGNLCKWNGTGGAYLNHPSTMEKYEFDFATCFCDSECHTFGDCCMDADMPTVTTLEENPWRCKKLPGPTNEHIYAIGSCPSNWTDDQEAALCQGQVPEDQYSYMLDILVFNDKRIPYANMFCARCHGDRNLPAVNVEIVCPFGLPSCGNFFNQAYYLEGKHRWQVYARGEFFAEYIELELEAYKHWSTVMDSFRPRRCRTVVDTCPKGNLELTQKCKSYVSYIQHGNTVYKNLHCALCNNPNLTHVNCETQGALPSLYDNADCKEPQTTTASFEWFLDLQAPLRATNGDLPIRCLEGEIFDPIHQICRSFLCPKWYRRRVSDQCERLTTCRVRTFGKDQVTEIGKGVIFVEETETTYRNYDFERSENESYVVCEPFHVLGESSIIQSSLFLMINLAFYASIHSFIP